MARLVQKTILPFISIGKQHDSEDISKVISQHHQEIRDFVASRIIAEPESVNERKNAPRREMNSPTKKRRRTWGAKMKQEIVALSREIGTNQAARRYGVNPGVLRRWKSELASAVRHAISEAATSGTSFVPSDETDVFHDKRAEFSGRKRVPASVENAIALRIQHLRSVGVVIDGVRLRAIAHSSLESRVFNPEEAQYKASVHWGERFLKRNSICRRRVTRSTNPGIESQKEKNTIRRVYLARLAYIQDLYNIPPELCFHADETGLQLLSSENYSYDIRGTKNVRSTFSSDKRQITVMLAGNVRGTILAPFVIFSDITQENLRRSLQRSGLQYDGVPENLHPVVWARTDCHWMDVEAAKAWIEKVLLPSARVESSKLGVEETHPVLLTWDVYTSHRSEALLAWVSENHPNVKIVFVPAKCTSFLQLVDVGLARPFKQRIAKMKEEWMFEELNPIAEQVMAMEGSEEYDADAAMAVKLTECSRLRVLRPKVLEWIAGANALLQERSYTLPAARAIGIDIALDPSQHGMLIRPPSSCSVS